MKETKLIRRAKRSDLDEIYQFEREYIIEHESDQLSRWDSLKIKNLELLQGNLGRMFVATVNDRLAGHGYWSLYLQKPCVFSIYVSKDFRHRGIATALMNAVENNVLESGRFTITLSTLVTNPAQYLFNKINYEVLDIKNGWIYYSKDLA